MERGRGREIDSENEKKLMNYGNLLDTLYFLVEPISHFLLAFMGLHWVYELQLSFLTIKQLSFLSTYCVPDCILSTMYIFSFNYYSSFVGYVLLYSPFY